MKNTVQVRDAPCVRRAACARQISPGRRKNAVLAGAALLASLLILLIVILPVLPRGKEAVPARENGYELPETGGGGTLLYTFCGTLLMSSAMYGFSVRRRSERGEDR